MAPRERVVVIGGGISGVLAALQLDRFYDVVLLERQRNLLTGSSIIPARLHLGGEYTLDNSMQTGFACIRAAIAFRQMLPDEIFSNEGCYFQASTASLDAITPEGIQEYYHALQREYSKLCQLSPENCVFGEPDDLYAPTPPPEGIKGVEGGVYARELGINPARLAAVLLCLLDKCSMEVVTNCEVVSVIPRHDGYRIHCLEKEGGRRETYYDCAQVVNTASESASVLEGKLKSDFTRLELRGMALLDTSAVPEEHRVAATKSYFVFEGQNGGMWHPFNTNFAYLYFPSPLSAYWEDDAFVKLWLECRSRSEDEASIPCSAKAQLDAECQARLQQQLKAQRAMFPFLDYCKADKMIVRQAVLTHDQQGDDNTKARRRRPYSGIRQIAPKFWAVRTEKATYAALIALHVLSACRRASGHQDWWSFPLEEEKRLDVASKPPIAHAFSYRSVLLPLNFDAIAETCALNRDWPVGFTKVERTTTVSCLPRRETTPTSTIDTDSFET